MDHRISDAARRLAKCRLVVVLTGAGISKESGIPTFRDAQEGLWAQYDPMVLATEAGYLANPALVWQWYDYRFGMIERAQPNAGHLAIAELERWVPQVVVVTQNIDGLHQIAGSTDVVGAARQHPQLQVPDRPARRFHPRRFRGTGRNPAPLPALRRPAPS